MRLVSWKYGNAIAVCAMAIVLGQIGAAQDRRARPRRKPKRRSSKRRRPRSDAAQPTPKAPPAAPPPRRQGPDPGGAEHPGGHHDHRSGRLRCAGEEDAQRDRRGWRQRLRPFQGDGRGAEASARTGPKNYFYEDLPLNVDIRPEVTENENRIRTRLILNYETFYPSKTSGMPAVRSVVTVNQCVMLENGKPLMVSQSADATTDRKVTVELKATILQ